MKQRLILCLAMLCLGAGALPGQQDEFDPLGEREWASRPKMVRLTVDMVDVPSNVLLDAMAQDDVQLSGDQELWKKAREMVSKGEAKSMDSLVLMTKPGLPARAETIQEFMYPTEYDSVGLPEPGKEPKPEEGAAENKAAAKPAPPPPAPVRASAGQGPRSPFHPAAFETRNLGTTVEVDPVVGVSGDTVDLTITVEHVAHLGDDVHGTWKDQDVEVIMRMPKFYTTRFKTQTVLVNGKVAMIGAVSPKDAGGKPDPLRKVLVFVKVDVLLAGD